MSREITVTLTEERFDAVRWAIHMGINLRNMAIQEALIEASNDFGAAALATLKEEGSDA